MTSDASGQPGTHPRVGRLPRRPDRRARAARRVPRIRPAGRFGPANGDVRINAVDGDVVRVRDIDGQALEETFAIEAAAGSLSLKAVERGLEIIVGPRSALLRHGQTRGLSLPRVQTTMSRRLDVLRMLCPAQTIAPAEAGAFEPARCLAHPARFRVGSHVGAVITRACLPRRQRSMRRAGQAAGMRPGRTSGRGGCAARCQLPRTAPAVSVSWPTTER